MIADCRLSKVYPIKESIKKYKIYVPILYTIYYIQKNKEYNEIH